MGTRTQVIRKVEVTWASGRQVNKHMEGSNGVEWR